MAEMSYQEFKKTYWWALKHYPQIDRLSWPICHGDESPIGTMIKTKYTRTSPSGEWKECEKSEEPFSARNYVNCVDGIPFFRNLGGYEHVDCGYTYTGYLPLEIVSISPDKLTRTVRKFRFEK